MADEREPSSEKSPFGEFETEPVREREASKSRFRINPQVGAFVGSLLLVAVIGVAAISGGGGEDASDGGGGSPGQVESREYLDCVEQSKRRGDLCASLRSSGDEVRSLYASCRSSAPSAAPVGCVALAECAVERGRTEGCLILARRRIAAETYLECRSLGRPSCLRKARLAATRPGR